MPGQYPEAAKLSLQAAIQTAIEVLNDANVDVFSPLRLAGAILLHFEAVD
ncbi:hypothetical protein [Cohnella sp.]